MGAIFLGDGDDDDVDGDDDDLMIAIVLVVQFSDLLISACPRQQLRNADPSARSRSLVVSLRSTQPMPIAGVDYHNNDNHDDLF